MRTNIEIDDQLMQQAMKLNGGMTKKAVVEAALKMLVARTIQGEAIDSLWGIGGWEGDLEWSRTKNKWADTGSKTSPLRRQVRKKAA